MNSTSMILPLAGLLATGLFASAAGNMQAPATAQITAKQYFACYVPATGTVYLIKQPGLRSECASGHVQFSWSDGASNPAVTPAVVVTDPDGWAATGTFGSGVIPVTGAGVRLMWYPRKAALRAGGVSATQWDDASIGNYSVALGNGTMATASRSTALGQNTLASATNATALGLGTTASGPASTALGEKTTASGLRSVAIGNFSTATLVGSIAIGQQNTASGTNCTAIGTVARCIGIQSTALGTFVTASGDGSVAMGQQTTASGRQSTAMGASTTASGSSSTAMGGGTTASGAGSTAIGTDASTNGFTGSFVYGDRSAFATRTVVQVTADNSFVVRATGGFRFRTAPDLSTGCNLRGGMLSCSGAIHSDVGGFSFPDGTVQTTAASGGTPAQGLAAVNGSGGLIRGHNVASISRVRAGVYTVTFTAAVNVAAGFYVVTPGVVGTCATGASAENSGTVANSVTVVLVAGDCAFSLAVF